MNPQDIYSHFGTPQGLQRHMLTVAGLVCTLQEHWTGEEVDWDAAITAALLHDIGNVIKFELDAFPELLGEELPRLEYWRGEQKRLIEKYGPDDHEATDKMLTELHISGPIREAIQSKSFGNVKTIASSRNWLVKILLYCDLRVLPDGVGTLDERVAEFKVRLKKYSERPDFPEMMAATKTLEKDIQASVNAKLDTIMTNAAAAKHQQRLSKFTIDL